MYTVYIEHRVLRSLYVNQNSSFEEEVSMKTIFSAFLTILPVVVFVLIAISVAAEKHYQRQEEEEE